MLTDNFSIPGILQVKLFKKSYLSKHFLKIPLFGDISKILF